MIFETVADSGQGNTYGGLDLVRVTEKDRYYREGDYYLMMGDCFGPDFTGPLTAEQVAAFYTLFEIEEKS